MSRPEPLLGWPGWRHLGLAAAVSLGGTVWFCLIYGGADAFTAHRHLRIRVHTEAELAIPFVPEAVVAYLSIYPLVLAAPFIVRGRREFLLMAWSLNLLILVAGVIFLLLPGQLAYAPPARFGAFPGLYRLADEMNLTYNLVPSLHVALSVFCSLVFAARAGRTGRVFLLGWAVVIALSTLLTHQHHVLDVLTGGLLAVVIYRRVFLRSVAKDPAPRPVP